MTAAATAGRIGQDLVDDHGDGARWLALVVVVAGGLVEGVALGVLQGRVLAGRWTGLHRIAYALVTVAIAGVGWAAASAPGVLAGDDDTGAGPPLGLVMLGALGIGVVMGPVLGGAQALVLRSAVPHSRRWVVASIAAWPPAMVVIFLGASTAGSGWPIVVVSAYGALTGVVAGSVLGLVSGVWLDALDGPPVVNRLVLFLVARQWLGLHRRVVGLAVRGRRTGRVLKLPVQFAPHGTGLVVVPGHPDGKTWWRNLSEQPVPVAVLNGSGWHPVTARLLVEGAPGHAEALAAYQRRWPRFRPEPDQPLVLLSGSLDGIARTRMRLESVGW
jgi:deazaflavin-dependent oxidoreductase (nitroreductase family)